MRITRFTPPGGREGSSPRLAAAFGSVLLAAVMLAACGDDDDDGTGDEVTITFWDNNGGVRTPIYEQLIPEFEAANPGINVEYVGVPIADVQQRYNTAIAGDGTPDVGGVTTSYLATLTSQDALEPLDERLAGSSLDGKLQEAFLETVRSTVPDGGLYLLPNTANLDVVWYVREKFESAGLVAPATWDEFFADAQQLTDRGAQQYGYTIRGGAGSIFQLLAEMYAYSGVTSFFDEQGQSTVNDPAHAAYIERIAALYNTVTPEADVNNGFPEMVAQFSTGTIAMMHHNLGSYNDHVEAHGDGNIAAFPLPVGATGARTVVPNPVDGFAVFRSSDNKDAAWRFVEFLVSRANNSFWNQEVGQIPANVDAAAEPWVSDRAHIQVAYETLQDPDTRIVPAPMYLPQWGAVTKDAEPQFQQVLLGELSAQEFLDGIADALTTAEAEWRAAQGG